MPIPKPNSGETREQFMNRCVSFVVNEGTPQEQAVAICSIQWDESEKIIRVKELDLQKKKAMSNQTIVNK